MPTKPLPPRPNLDQYRKQAKELLRACKDGNADALARAAEHLHDRPPAALADAQFVIAREHGFESWPEFKRHIESIAPPPADPMREFRQAINRGDAPRLRKLLENHPALREQVNAPLFDFGRRPIHAAAKHRDVLDVLIEHGADLSLRSDWPNGPFSVLDDAPEEIARYLLTRGATLTAHAAARFGWLDELRAMVQGDPAVVHEKGGDGQRPLHFASTPAIVDFLLDHGAEIDALCVDHHSSPAQYAVADRPDVCRRLLERGATPDIFMAARLGDADLVRRCIAQQPGCLEARIGAGGYGRVPPDTIYIWTLGNRLTPHQVALEAGHQAVHDLLVAQSPPEMRFLAACASADAAAARAILDADPGLPNRLKPDQLGLIGDAAFRDDTAAVELMLELGFPIDSTHGGWHGATPLHHAAWRGHLPTVELLLRHNPPLEVRDRDHGSTPLGWACHGSVHCRNPDGDYPAVVERLIAAGCQVHTSANKDDISMVQQARGNQAVEAVLRRHGVGDG